MTKQKKTKKRPPWIEPGKTFSDVRKFHEGGAGKKATSVEPPEGGWDSSYVPGFSELRHKNQELESRGRKPVSLPANCVWPRATGDADYRGMIEWRRKGYQLVNDAYEDENGRHSPMLEQYGYGVPPAAQIMKDGTIRRDDTLLAICPGDVHAQNVREHEEYRRYWQGQVGGENIDMETEEEYKVKLTDADVSFEK